MSDLARYADGEGEPRRLLCFGDSNTWGYEPGTGRRFGEGIRWTGRLAAELAPGWRLVDEGLCSRTTVFEDPMSPGRRGLEALPLALESHQPLDLVVLMLGTNDYKRRFSAGDYEIAMGLERLARLVLASSAGRGGRAPALLLVAPPPLGPLGAAEEAFAGGRESSLRLPGRLEALAANLGAAYLDAGSVVASSPVDGIHLDPPAHAALAEAFAARIRGLAASARP
ncbi:MAG: SGNH/GDSL hydrolase family protein [Spirochaetaceae bacterium]|nr:SGNH/GDSL hydrolase family protein [Spirochaetaceae bacterium]